MKISTNSIGNYKPVLSKKIKPANNKADTEKVKLNTKISKNEKTFFKKLYPELKQEINNYRFYNKNGIRNVTSLGSLFDKRG